MSGQWQIQYKSVGDLRLAYEECWRYLQGQPRCLGCCRELSKCPTAAGTCLGGQLRIVGALVSHPGAYTIYGHLPPLQSGRNQTLNSPVISALTLCCELLLHGPQVTVLTKPFASHIIPYQKKHSLRRALVPSIPWCLNDENSLFLSPSRLYPEDPSSSNLKRLRF